VPGHWLFTSTHIHDSGNQFNYVMKDDSRIDGPWDDRSNFRPPPTLTRQLKHFMTLPMYPWQEEALGIVKSSDDCYIHYIYDPHYNFGKFIFCEYCEYHFLGEEIPPFILMEDIM